MRNLWQRLVDLPHHLNTREKIIALTLVLVLVFLGAAKIKNYFYNRLVELPAAGGTFTEGVVGQPHLLSPISSLDTNERTILSLIYVGLTETTADGRTLPVLAESWVISEDGQTYTFTLKPNLKWHDGQPLTTSDVAETIRQVSDPETKSPFLADWAGVTVDVKDERTIAFHLDAPNAPFLATTDLPIIPIHISNVDLQQSLIGNGPYAFENSKTKDDQITEVRLKSFEAWPGGRPYINQLVWRFYDSTPDLVKDYQNGQVDSFAEWSSATPNLSGAVFRLPSQRHRLLFLNTARDNIKDVNNRKHLLDGTKLDNPITLKIITQPSLAGHQDFVAQLKVWTDLGITVNLEQLDSVALLDRIDSHDYDVLFADIDLRADLDIYPLWHSSQRGAGGYNFAQLDDKETDQKLEEARRTLDLNKRRLLTEEAERRLHDLAVYQDLEQVPVIWHVNNRILGIPKLQYVVDSPDRFADIAHWYIKTRHRPGSSLK